MAKLNVLENKKLVLKNILKRELRNISMEDMDKEIQSFGNKLELLKVQTFGPLVIKACGVNILEDGTISTDYDLFIQAHDYKQYKAAFVIEEKHVCEHCVYVHFEGKSEDINYAHSKLDLHFYENDLESNGVTYTVCIQEASDYAVIDLFKPVIVL